jgi:hypothetical protein
MAKADDSTSPTSLGLKSGCLYVQLDVEEVALERHGGLGNALDQWLSTRVPRGFEEMK